MRKLEDISKKDIFTTPEGYFEKLPGVVQSRVEDRKPVLSPVMAFSLKYALPVIIFLVAGVFWFTQSNQSVDINSMLSAVQTEDLVAYLDESDMTTEEVIESGNFNTTDIREIEGEVYDLNMTNEDIQNMIDDLE